MLRRPTPRHGNALARRLWMALALVVSISALSVPPTQAQGAPQAPAGGGPGFLTGPAAGDPLVIALDYLRQHAGELGLSGDDLREITVKDRYVSAHNGVTHLYLRQRHQGVEVFNGDINVNIARDGSIINLGNGFVGGLAQRVNSTQPALSAPQALAQAAAGLGLAPTSAVAPTRPASGPDNATEVSSGGVSADPVPMRLIYQPTADGSVRLAWNMVLRLPERDEWLDLRADAENGQILSQVNWVSDSHAPGRVLLRGRTIVPGAPRPAPLTASPPDSYAVIPLPADTPLDGIQTMVSSPADSAASPYGWHDTDGATGAEYTSTQGNNAFAYADLVAPDGYSAGDLVVDGGPDRIFEAPLDVSLPVTQNREAAITQLFFITNAIHDILYHYGFDEAGGNFQQNTYGRGGVGADAVKAEAQDYSGINNANFSTPPDGQQPRMQMYLGSPTAWLTVQAPFAGSYPSGSASFGPATYDVTGDVALVQDGTAPATDGCQSSYQNPVAGMIALIDRGLCSFAIKARIAQDSGAIAVIIVNNAPGAAPTLGADGTEVSIPTLSLSQSDGQQLKDQLNDGRTVRVRLRSDTYRDGTIDTGVIIHEYGHGLSNRLTGGPSNTACLAADESRGLGEGWSDFLALTLTARATDTRATQHPVGLWLNGDQANGPGIRHYPYTTDTAVNPYTFEDIKPFTGPHDIGEVWATALWEVYWNLTEQHGFDPNLYGGAGGNNLALQLVIDGMKLQPCNPTLVEARDAILLADMANTGGANQCLIWAGFVKRGLGYSADAGDSSIVSDSVEAFDLHPSCAVSVEPKQPEVCIADVSDQPFTIGLGESLSGPITLSASGHPAGTTASFNPNPATAPGSATLTLGNLGAAAPGSYTLQVTGNDGSDDYVDTATLHLADQLPDAAALLAPADGEVDAFERVEFRWDPVPQAARYRLELASDPAFATLVFSTTLQETSYTYPIDLLKLQSFHWRVIAINGCGEGAPASASFTTRDVPRLLLVDDDANFPDVQPVYTDLLNQLGVPYDTWDTGDSGLGEPDAGAFTNYELVLWVGGPEAEGRPEAESEAILASFLDAGHCLLVTAQDYFARRGVTPFMQSYLGVNAAVDDVGHTSVTGAGPFAGLGTLPLDFPTGYENYTDQLTPAPGASAAFTSDKGTAAVYKDTGVYRTLFMAFPLEAIDARADRLALIEQALAWCEPQNDLALAQGGTPMGDMLPGQPLTYTLSFHNDLGMAEDTRLALALPAQLANVQVTGATPAGAGEWQLGTVAPGASGVVTVTATIDGALSADATLTIAAEIGGARPDADETNNRVTTSLRVVVPRVSFASASLSAGEGDGAVNVGVILDRANPYGPTLVDLAAGAGQAQSGIDFTLAAGSLSIPAGATSAGLALTIVDDALAEPAESVALTLANPRGAALGAPSSATLSIADDDGPATPAETYEVHLPFVAR
jgi:hypothetical protein